MQTFIIKLIVAALSNPQVQAAVVKLVAPLIPIAVGAAVKEGMDQLIQRIPGIEGVVDVVKATDSARNALNDLIPDFDFGNAALDNLLDFWRPRV